MVGRSRTSFAKMAEKDQRENELHAEVRAGKMLLAEAQHSIASNWWSAGSNT
jgi:hypothetical protein